MKWNRKLMLLVSLVLGGVPLTTAVSCDPYNGFAFFRDRGDDECCYEDYYYDDYYYDDYYYDDYYYYDDCYYGC